VSAKNSIDAKILIMTVSYHNRLFTTETLSSQSSEHFLIKNALLCALRVSAVSHSEA
jgi:hypothetical protein